MIASWWNPPGWRCRPKGIDYPFALRRRHIDRLPAPAEDVVTSSSGLKFSTCSLALYYCVREVTVTSLHPPCLCRIAVLWVKPIITSRALVSRR